MSRLFIQPVCRGFYWKPTIMTGGHYHCTSPHVFVDETGTFDHGVRTWCGFFYLGCLEMGYWTYASFSQSHFASFLWAFWDDTSFGYGTEHMVYQSAISTLKMKALNRDNTIKHWNFGAFPFFTQTIQTLILWFLLGWSDWSTKSSSGAFVPVVTHLQPCYVRVASSPNGDTNGAARLQREVSPPWNRTFHGQVFPKCVKFRLIYKCVWKNCIYKC